MRVIFALCLTTRLAMAADPFVIVSDVDDTIKITNVLDPAQAARNALHSKLVFAGMPVLYTEMLGPGASAERLRFISGSPRAIGHKIRELLTESKFPPSNLTVRGFRETATAALEYKTRRLQELYGSSGDRFILIGDDTESDPEVYAAFAASKPGQVLAIYIRTITGRRLPAGHIPFVTAYDIATHEVAAGRLSIMQAAAVGRAVVASTDTRLLPRFQICPSQISVPDAGESLHDHIRRRLRELCADRATP